MNMNSCESILGITKDNWSTFQVHLTETTDKIVMQPDLGGLIHVLYFNSSHLITGFISVCKRRMGDEM